MNDIGQPTNATQIDRGVAGQPRLRLASALVLWLLAATILALIALGHGSPASATHVAALVLNALLFVLQLAVLLGVLALLFWPPAMPWLRLRLRLIRDQLGVNSQAFRESAARLEHLETAPDLITVGRYLSQVGQDARAVPLLERAARLEPDNLVTRMLLGRALLRSGDPDRAVPHLQHLVRQDPNHAYGEGLLRLGEALAACHQFEPAAAVLLEHEERNGPLREVDLLRARLAKRRGDLPAARHFARRAAKAAENRKLLPAEALDRARARVLSWSLGGGPSHPEGREPSHPEGREPSHPEGQEPSPPEGQEVSHPKGEDSSRTEHTPGDPS